MEVAPTCPSDRAAEPLGAYLVAATSPLASLSSAHLPRVPAFAPRLGHCDRETHTEDAEILSPALVFLPGTPWADLCLVSQFPQLKSKEAMWNHL